jgi:antitoxin component of MazEF toxin-antitoxin module
MQASIKKFGNSLGISIPNILLKKLSLHQGSLVNFMLKDNGIVLSPQKYNLADFLSQITDANKHPEFWD